MVGRATKTSVGTVRENLGRLASSQPWFKALVTFLFLAPFLLLFIMLVGIPTIGLIMKAFTTNNSLELEVINPSNWGSIQFTGVQFSKVFSETYYQITIMKTIWVAVASVILSAVFGIPIAYLVTKRKFKFGRRLRQLISIPIYVPTVVASYALLLFFGTHGILSELAVTMFGTRIRLAFTLTGVILGTFYIVVPTYIRTVASSFESVDPSLAEASMSLGATEFVTFRKILIPLVLPGVFAATVLGFTMAMGIVVIALIIGGGSINVQILPVEILQKTINFGYNIPLASAMAVILLVIAFIGQLVVVRLTGDRGRSYED